MCIRDRLKPWGFELRTQFQSQRLVMLQIDVFVTTNGQIINPEFRLTLQNRHAVIYIHYLLAFGAGI